MYLNIFLTLLEQVGDLICSGADFFPSLCLAVLVKTYSLGLGHELGQIILAGIYHGEQSLRCLDIFHPGRGLHHAAHLYVARLVEQLLLSNLSLLFALWSEAQRCVSTFSWDLNVGIHRKDLSVCQERFALTFPEKAS